MILKTETLHLDVTPNKMKTQTPKILGIADLNLVL